MSTAATISATEHSPKQDHRVARDDAEIARQYAGSYSWLATIVPSLVAPTS